MKKKRCLATASTPTLAVGRSALVREDRKISTMERKRGSRGRTYHSHEDLGNARKDSKKSSLACSNSHRETIRFQRTNPSRL
jgi:hypothetical protein